MASSDGKDCSFWINRGSLFNRAWVAALYNAQFIEGVDIDDNSLPAVWYTDVTGVLKLGACEVFLTGNNLADKEPPASPAASTFQDGADRSLYDFIGRYYTAGVRLRL